MLIYVSLLVSCVPTLEQNKQKKKKKKKKKKKTIRKDYFFFKMGCAFIVGKMLFL